MWQTQTRPQWQNAANGKTKELLCPGTGEVVSVIPASGAEDGDAAVNPGAPETPDDGIDSNCDGEDNT